MSRDWNYRLVRHVEPDGRAWLAIHEVRYDADGRPRSVTEEEASPGGETLEAVRADLKHMMTALDRPVLELTAERD